MGLFNRILGSIYGRTRTAYFEHRYDFFRQKYDVDSGFRFEGTDIRLYGSGEIHLGFNSYMGSYSTMASAEGYKIVVGRNCQISHNVRMYTSSADPDQDFTKEKTKPNKYGNIIIEDGVWIGANVFIGPGIKIRANSVVGANSMVTKNVESNCVVGGVPAKLIRKKRL